MAWGLPRLQLGALILLLLRPGTFDPHAQEQAPPARGSSRPVLRRRWREGEDVTRVLAARRPQPLVLTHTPAREWALMGWTPRRLSALPIPLLLTAKTAADPRFLYAVQSNGRDQFPGWQPTYGYENMSAATFFKRADACATATGPREYMQYSAPLGSPERGMAALLAELRREHDWPLLAASDQQLPQQQDAAATTHVNPDAAPAAHIKPMIWMGSTNATTTLHYDTAHNTYVQVHGRKRFLLLPPGAMLTMPSFPEAHPSNRQARARPAGEQAGPALHEVLAQAGGAEDLSLEVLEAVLVPGDVLLLPAHWGHYVVALDTSVSVNLWTPSREEHVMNQLMAPPQPWPEGLDLRSLLLCTQLLLRTVLRHALSYPALARKVNGKRRRRRRRSQSGDTLSPRQARRAMDRFIRHLLERKGYDDLDPPPAAGRAGAPLDGCAVPDDVEQTAAGSGMPRTMRDLILSRGEQTGRAFGDDSLLSPAVAGLHLETYLEVYAKNTAGVGSVGAFLRGCLCSACPIDADSL